MTYKVGIPRALFYYKFYPFWTTFFNELGVETVVSEKTTKKILDDGVKSCVDEACLAIKVFYGHVLNLKDRVDYLLIPRFTSISKREFICPKFGGLPDMIRNTVSGLPEIIDTEVKMYKDERNSFYSAYETGKIFCSSKSKISCAYKNALSEYRKFRSWQKNGNLDVELYQTGIAGEKFQGFSTTGEQDKKLKKNSEKQDCGLMGQNLRIALIGHVYNVYDSFVNMDLLKKLKNMGVQVETPEMYSRGELAKNTRVLRKRLFWNFGTTAMGYTLELLRRRDIDGIIYLMAFGCGIDSFICDLAERKIRNNSNIPFIVLTIDEHTGEAGLNTRLEAFVDMIRYKKAKGDGKISIASYAGAIQNYP